jgi:hypothetical protein
MRKVLVFTLVLFCLTVALPLVSANPVPDFKNSSAYTYSYIALIILVITTASLVVVMVRKKKITKLSFLYLSVFSCWISSFAIGIYSSDLTVMIGKRITSFGYITLAISYATMATTLLTTAYSGYWINKRLKGIHGIIVGSILMVWGSYWFLTNPTGMNNSNFPFVFGLLPFGGAIFLVIGSILLWKCLPLFIKGKG